MIPTPKPGVGGPPRSKSNPKPPSHYCSQFKRGPQMIVTLPYIWCAKPGMTCTNDARVTSSNEMHQHRPRAWETNGGNQGALVYYKHMRARQLILNFRSRGCRTVGSM